MKFLNPDVLAILIIDMIFLIFALLAFVNSFKIVKKWDINSTTPLQYELEKKSYLIATIVKYIFYLKLPLFIYFIHTLDKLSVILPGAMCAAGVTNATIYGVPLFIIKIFNLYFFGFWLVINRIDVSRKNYPFTKEKFLFFIFIFPILFIETLLEILHFGNINPQVIVSCCGTLFSSSKTSPVSIFIKIPTFWILSVFYGNFLLIVFSYILKRALFVSLLNMLFIPVAIISLIVFFSTYVYELPQHHCPFCLLQKDYYYIGYFMYTFLYLGTFFAMAGYIALKLNYENSWKWLKLSVILDGVYVLLVSFYPLAYYFKNGVWL
jgi:hypothetical protein